MALRSIRSISSVCSSLRKYSTSNSLVTLSLNEKTGVTTATLNSPPVNSLNLELLTEISKVLQDLEKDKSRGLILTSSSKSVFSAGLDILEMYKPNIDRFRQFWKTVQDTWINLYGTSYPTVAAINGHAPAGGCLLAMSCEYRVMLNNFTIGLNETQLGMIAPEWFATTMRNTIGRRQTEYSLLTGRLHSTDEALKIGLIDETATSKEEALEKAANYINKFAKIPPFGRSMTKHVLRRADIKKLQETRDQELQVIESVLNNESVQKSIGAYLETLKKKRAK